MNYNFPLENGIYCKGTSSNFKLYYGNIELTSNCNAISYIPNILIAVKSNNVVYVYEPSITTHAGNPILNLIASFKRLNYYTYLKTTIKNKEYIIDVNVHVTLCKSTN